MGHPTRIHAITVLNERVACAAEIVSGTIHGEDNHISRIPMILDPEGYEELIKFLSNSTEELVGLQQRVASRMKKGGETILTKVHIIQFESPDPEEVS